MRNTALSLCLVLLAAGCGIKPAFVDPPQGAAHDKFPHTYPNAATLKNNNEPAPAVATEETKAPQATLQDKTTAPAAAPAE